MNRIALSLLTAGVAAAVGGPTPAPAIDFPNFGLGLFNRKPKAEEPPPQAAPTARQYIAVLQRDPDERKRVYAAQALRTADPRTDAAIVPALIGSLQRDPSPTVRSQAAGALGGMKPIYQHAGLALQASAQADPAEAVREASKAALWQYHLAGYRLPEMAGQRTTQTAEPPIASPRPSVPVAVVPGPAAPAPGTTDAEFRPISIGVGKAATFQQTVEPPLAAATAVPPPSPTASVPTPAPAPPPAVPSPVKPVPTVSIPQSRPRR